MSQYNLVSEQWIPALCEDGAHTLSLFEVFENRVFAINTADPLERAAIHRLLLAITIASRSAQITEKQWLSNHAHRFDILDSKQPFGQNINLSEVPMEKRSSIMDVLLDYSSGTGSSGIYKVLENPKSTSLPLDEAARLILVRQMFSPGGLGSRFGKYTGSTVTSFKQSLHYNTPFVWLSMPELSLSLSVMADLLTKNNPPMGKFWFCFENDVTPGDVIEEPGVLDMLTYPSRSLKIWRSSVTEEANYIAAYEGLRIPELGSNADLYKDVFKQTSWWSMDGKKPAAPRGVRTADNVRPAWKHLFECYATKENPSIVSLDESLPEESIVEITALAGDKSRIDNTICWIFPSPNADRETVKAIDFYFNAVRRSNYGLYKSAADCKYIGNADDVAAVQNMYSDYFDQMMNKVVPKLLSERKNLEYVKTAFESVFLGMKNRISNDLSMSYPDDSARISTRKSPEWMEEISMKKEHQ